MPSYEVELQDGRKFEVEVDRAPSSHQELVSAIQSQLSTSEQPQAKTEGPSLLSQIGTAVKRGALPTIGAALGATAGGILTSPTVGGVPAGILAGEALGSMAGEGANQLLGITEPSPGEVALAAVAPSAGRAAFGAGRYALSKLPRIIPGGSIALQQRAADVAKTAPNIIRGEASGPLYQQVEQLGSIPIAGTNLKGAITALQGQEGKAIRALQNTEVTKVLSGLDEVLTQGQGSVPLDVMRENLSRLGKQARALEDSNPQASGALKKLYRAGMQDLESTGGPVGDVLKAANKAYRKEQAAETLSDWIEGTATRQGAIGQRTADSLTYFSPGKVLDKIRRDEFFRKSLDPDELKQVTDLMERLSKTPSLPPVRGAQYGSAMALGRGAAAGGVSGYLSGDPALAGLVAGTAAYGPQLIAKAVMTDTGRKLLGHLLDRGPFLDAPRMSILAAFLRSQSGQGASQ